MEREMIRRLVMNAVANGQFEVMIYSFPSNLCTDRGRAINNTDPTWPDTLQGKGAGVLRPLQGEPSAQGLQTEGHDPQIPGRYPWRCRLLPQLGSEGRLNPLAPSPRCLSLRSSIQICTTSCATGSSPTARVDAQRG
jgi:hypothetical protein